MELVDKVLAEEKAPAPMKAVCEKIKKIDQYDEKGAGVEEMRAAVKELKSLIGTECCCPIGKALKAVADNLVRKSVWVLGGDGWAYDIGATACAPFGSPSASCPSRRNFFGAFRRA